MTYVDVGAMGGISRKWAQVKECLQVIGFEPDKREFKKLQSSEAEQFLNYIVYKQSADIQLNVTQDPGKTSIYKPNLKVLNEFPDADRHQVVESIRFSQDTVDSLDNILKKHGLDADFLKIDTQGSELDILEGAERSLENIFGVELEVEFLPLYEGQALFPDVHSFMTHRGFVLYDLRRAFWKRKEYFDYIGKGQLIFGDALYVKQVGHFLESLGNMKDEEKRILKILCSVTACLVYGVYDYAFSITEGVFKKGYISLDYKNKMIEGIGRVSKKSFLPHFWGREFLYKGFNKMAELLQPKSYLGWADGDRFIGNARNG